jgi:hypothetical protein
MTKEAGNGIPATSAVEVLLSCCPSTKPVEKISRVSTSGAVNPSGLARVTLMNGWVGEAASPQPQHRSKHKKSKRRIVHLGVWELTYHPTYRHVIQNVYQKLVNSFEALGESISWFF